MGKENELGGLFEGFDAETLLMFSVLTTKIIENHKKKL